MTGKCLTSHNQLSSVSTHGRNLGFSSSNKTLSFSLPLEETLEGNKDVRMEFCPK